MTTRIAVALGLALLAACGDAATSNADAAAPSGPPACPNTLTNTAPPVTRMDVASAMPSATSGGTIVPGTYYLTGFTHYTGPGGATGPSGSRQTTSVIAAKPGGGYYVSWVSDTSSPPRANAVATASGTSYTQMLTCPAVGTATLGYDATPTQITIYDAPSKEVSVLTLQGASASTPDMSIAVGGDMAKPAGADGGSGGGMFAAGGYNCSPRGGKGSCNAPASGMTDWYGYDCTLDPSAAPPESSCVKTTNNAGGVFYCCPDPVCVRNSYTDGYCPPGGPPYAWLCEGPSPLGCTQSQTAAGFCCTRPM